MTPDAAVPPSDAAAPPPDAAATQAAAGSALGLAPDIGPSDTGPPSARPSGTGPVAVLDDAPRPRPGRVRAASGQGARRRWAVLRRIAWACAIAVALVATVGFLAVPPLAKHLLQTRLAQWAQRPVVVERVEFNPFTWRASVHGLQVLQQPGEPALLELDALRLRLAPASVWRRAPVLSMLRLEGPRLRLAHLGNGRWNFSDIADRLRAAPSGPTPAFSLANIELASGRIEIDDRPAGTRHLVESIDAGVPFVSSLPVDAQVTVQPRLGAVIDGARLQADAQALPFAASPSSTVRLRLAALDLTRLLAYVPDPPPLQLRAATLDGELVVVFGQPTNAAPTVRVDGTVALHGLDLAEPDGSPLLSSPAVGATFSADPVAGRLDIARLAIERAVLTLRRRADGTSVADRIGAWRAAGRTPVAGAPAVGAPTRDAPTRDASAGSAPAGSAPVANAPAAGEPASGEPTASTPAAGEPAAAPRVRIAELVADGLSIDARDEHGAAPFALAVRAGKVAVRGFDSAAGTRASFEVDLPADSGERLSAKGGFGLAPLAADATVDLAGIGLRRWWPQVAGLFAFEPVSGTVGATAQLRFAPVPGRTGLTVSALDVGVDHAAFGQGGAELARLASLRVSGARIDVDARAVQVAGVDASDGSVSMRRSPDGRLDWSGLMRSAAAPASAVQSGSAPAVRSGPAADSADPAASGRPTASGAAPRPWSWTVARADVRAVAVQLQDQGVTPAVRTTARIDEARLSGLSGEPGQPAQLELRARVDPGATLSARGTVRLAPHAVASLEVDLRRLAVVPLAPYYAAHVDPQITRGTVSGRGRLDVDAGPALRIGWRGDLSADDFRVQEPDGRRALLRWKSIALSAVMMTATPQATDPLALDVGAVDADTFFARLVVNPSGRLNLQGLAGKADRPRDGDPPGAPPGPGLPNGSPAAAPPRPDSQPRAGNAGSDRGDMSDYGQQRAAAAPLPAAAAPAAAPPRVRIGRVTLRNGTVAFTDLFVRPNYSADLQSVEGTISTITPDAPGEVRLRARLDGYAPVEVTGRINPLADELFLDLAATARGIDLPPLSPYSAKYAGYGIERGKLSMSVSYHIEARALTAQNRLVLDQLTFGPKIDSPTATHLPVQFLVSLLQDRNGTINLELPISGSLDDPQFSIGAVVGRALRNLLARIVASPFSFLASLGKAAGSAGSEAPSEIVFDAGASGLPDAARGALATLAGALADRPALKVDLVGRADAASDRARLVEAGFERRLRAQKLRTLREAGGAAPPIDQVRIEPQEYEAVLTAAYRAADLPDRPRTPFGTLAKVPTGEMERMLRAAVQVGEPELRALANARARAVERALVEAGVAPERLFVAAPQVAGGGGREAGGRVDGGSSSNGSGKDDGSVSDGEHAAPGAGSAPARSVEMALR